MNFVYHMQAIGLASQAISRCSSLKKPTDSEARALARLFPSSAKRTATVAVFDPNECVAEPQQKKKKRAYSSQGRPVNITVVLLKSFSSTIPKGKLRKALKDSGRIKTVALTRLMSAQQVRNSIIRAFHPLLGTEWIFLDCNQESNCLEEAKDQGKSGDTIVSRRGCLYLCKKETVDDEVKLLSVNIIQ